MVNSGLRGAKRGCREIPSRIRALTSIVRIFATNAALTNEIIIEAENPRSRFGPADSWVIKGRGRQFLPWGVKELRAIRRLSAATDSPTTGLRA
jgi:hypothetical protein